MKQRSIYYFLGDTYSEQILSFLRNLLPYEFVKVSSPLELRFQRAQWIIVSPTVDSKAQDFILEAALEYKIALLLDWNHSHFGDSNALLDTKKVNLILAPWKIDTNIRNKVIPSIHGLWTRKTVLLKEPLNKEDHFFCSQPLREDRPQLGFDQYDLLKALLRIRPLGQIWVKRHPRETSELPIEIAGCSRIKIWESTIEEALSMFYYWYGLNSMPLYDAQSLGHSVTFLKS